MKSAFQIALVLFFLESCTNDDRCVRDCDKNFSICLLVATNENSLGIGFICKAICDDCKSDCHTVTSSGGRSSSTSRGGSGGGGGGGSSGGGGGGGHGGGGHGGSGITF
ncbi:MULTISPECIES: hypothetical protein [unclassified Leptospira]|uniref:hypothetical protein n=1 Tax=unclassified Leptospira TaxID=2633828 RepID=UPI00034D541F|nr:MULTISPECIES: hypothetical protein [unclassified Leptospira]